MGLRLGDLVIWVQRSRAVSVTGLVAVLAAGCVGGPAAPVVDAAPMTLAGIAGQWTVSEEDGDRVITMNGELPARPPDGDAIVRLFGTAADASAMLAMTSAPGAYPMAVASEVENFTGGRLRVEFKLIGGASDQIAGLTFNLHGDGTYNYGRYNTKDGNVAVWKFENGARAVLQHGEAHEQLPLGVWHTLDVEVRGRVVTVSAADGRLTATHTLEAPVAGRVGVWTKADSITAFRRLTIDN